MLKNLQNLPSVLAFSLQKNERINAKSLVNPKTKKKQRNEGGDCEVATSKKWEISNGNFNSHEEQEQRNERILGVKMIVVFGESERERLGFRDLQDCRH